MEDIFHEQLKGFFFSPEKIAQYLLDADRTINDKEELLKTNEKERGNIRTEMDKVYKLYIDGEINSKEFGMRQRKLTPLG